MSSGDSTFDWIDVDRARAKVQPSEVPEDARVLGLAVPPSYRAFLRAHGYGLFGGLLHFFPWAPGYGDDLVLRAAELRAMFVHTLRLEIAELEPDGSPEALAELVPFGISINGHTLCWSTRHAVDGEPEVVVVGPKVLAFHRTGMTFGALLRALTEPVGARLVMGPDAKGLPPTFRPSRGFDAWRRAALELSFAEVVDRVRAKKSFGQVDGFYVWPEQWRPSPLTASLFAFDRDVTLEDDRDRPRHATELSLHALVKIGDLEDVIADRERRAPGSSLEDFVRAVEHFREHGTFER